MIVGFGDLWCFSPRSSVSTHTVGLMILLIVFLVQCLFFTCASNSDALRGLYCDGVTDKGCELDELLQWYASHEPSPLVGGVELYIRFDDTTCASEDARFWLGRAAAFLHAYWPFEALRALAQAVASDKHCAVLWAYVASALSWNPGYARPRREAKRRAQALYDAANATELSVRESVMILALRMRGETVDELYDAGLDAAPGETRAVCKRAALNLFCRRRRAFDDVEQAIDWSIDALVWTSRHACAIARRAACEACAAARSTQCICTALLDPRCGRLGDARARS